MSQRARVRPNSSIQCYPRDFLLVGTERKERKAPTQIKASIWRPKWVFRQQLRGKQCSTKSSTLYFDWTIGSSSCSGRSVWTSLFLCTTEYNICEKDRLNRCTIFKRLSHPAISDSSVAFESHLKHLIDDETTFSSRWWLISVNSKFLESVLYFQKEGWKKRCTEEPGGCFCLWWTPVSALPHVQWSSWNNSSHLISTRFCRPERTSFINYCKRTSQVFALTEVKFLALIFLFSLNMLKELILEKDEFG